MESIGLYSQVLAIIKGKVAFTFQQGAYANAPELVSFSVPLKTWKSPNTGWTQRCFARGEQEERLHCQDSREKAAPSHCCHLPAVLTSFAILISCSASACFLFSSFSASCSCFIMSSTSLASPVTSAKVLSASALVAAALCSQQVGEDGRRW